MQQVHITQTTTIISIILLSAVRCNDLGAIDERSLRASTIVIIIISITDPGRCTIASYLLQCRQTICHSVHFSCTFRFRKQIMYKSICPSASFHFAGDLLPIILWLRSSRMILSNNNSILLLLLSLRLQQSHGVCFLVGERKNGYYNNGSMMMLEIAICLYSCSQYLGQSLIIHRKGVCVNNYQLWNGIIEMKVWINDSIMGGLQTRPKKKEWCNDLICWLFGFQKFKID